ncbi:putative O-acyltransferase WSD1-like [Capsicum annuum]|nr:putative O-acyltransferase WSD1-like [Capsicum annuum]KAF3680538.1 putative O-acyltransferase WSD1-like [Capsicum annuum]
MRGGDGGTLMVPIALGYNSGGGGSNDDGRGSLGAAVVGVWMGGGCDGAEKEDWGPGGGGAALMVAVASSLGAAMVLRVGADPHCSKQNEDCGSSGTQEPDGAEFISALAAGMSAKLMVEVTSEVSPSTVALAAAARQTGGKLVCIIPEQKLDKTQKVIEETGLNDMVEFKTGDPVDVLPNYENVDFSLVDCKAKNYDMLIEKLDVNQERSVVIANNVERKKGVQVLSSRFDNNSSGTLFYILCRGESSCSEDVMFDVGLTEYDSVGACLNGSLVLFIFLEACQTSIDVGS